MMMMMVMMMLIVMIADAESRLECVDRELRGPLAQRCDELYSFNVRQRTRHECQYVSPSLYRSTLVRPQQRNGLIAQLWDS